MMKKVIMLMAIALTMLIAAGPVSAVTNPSCDFTASPVTGHEDLLVNFTGTASGMTPLFSYHWDFGDGTGAEKTSVSLVSPISHTYLTPGVYTVRLAVYDLGIPTTLWVSNTKSNYITVTNIPPVAAFDMDHASPAATPLEVTFTDQSTGIVDSILWDFGDGTQSTEGKGTSILHTYAAVPTPTSYIVTLTATNDGGNTTATKSLDVLPPKPVADGDASSATTGAKPFAVQFVDTSSGYGINNWTWDFGDGGSSTEKNPLHVYTVAGNYTVGHGVSSPSGSDYTSLFGKIVVLNSPSVCPDPIVCPDPETDDSLTVIGSVFDGVFHLRTTDSYTGISDVNVNYGIPTDTPLLGDWNGDGIETIGIFRNNAFYLKNTNTNGFADIAFIYGAPGDTPVVGDWNGDGTDTIGIIRNGVIYARNTNTAGNADLVFGLIGGSPVIGK